MMIQGIAWQCHTECFPVPASWCYHAGAIMPLPPCVLI